MTAENNRSSAPVTFLLLAVAVLLGSVLMFQNRIKFTHHARTSHAEATGEIDNCFMGGGTLSPTYKLDNGRYGQFCNDGGRNNYWRIFECRKEGVLVITQFKQNIRKLANYIRNHRMEAIPEEALEC